MQMLGRLFYWCQNCSFFCGLPFFTCYFLYDLSTFFFREKLPSPTKLTFCAKIELDATQLLAMQIFLFILYWVGLFIDVKIAPFSAVCLFCMVCTYMIQARSQLFQCKVVYGLRIISIWLQSKNATKHPVAQYIGFAKQTWFYLNFQLPYVEIGSKFVQIYIF